MPRSSHIPCSNHFNDTWRWFDIFVRVKWFLVLCLMRYFGFWSLQASCAGHGPSFGSTIKVPFSLPMRWAINLCTGSLPPSASFTLKKATKMYSEMLKQLQHMSRLNPKDEVTHLMSMNYEPHRYVLFVIPLLLPIFQVQTLSPVPCSENTLHLLS